MQSLCGLFALPCATLSAELPGALAGAAVRCGLTSTAFDSRGMMLATILLRMFRRTNVKTKLRLVLMSLLLVAVVLGCTPPGGSTTGPVVYPGGYKDYGTPGYWENGVWTGLPPLGTRYAEVTSLIVSGSDIYAGGWCDYLAILTVR